MSLGARCSALPGCSSPWATHDFYKYIICSIFKAFLLCNPLQSGHLIPITMKALIIPSNLSNKLLILIPLKLQQVSQAGGLGSLHLDHPSAWMGLGEGWRRWETWGGKVGDREDLLLGKKTWRGKPSPAWFRSSSPCPCLPCPCACPWWTLMFRR